MNWGQFNFLLVGMFPVSLIKQPNTFLTGLNIDFFFLSQDIHFFFILDFFHIRLSYVDWKSEISPLFHFSTDF